MKKLGILFIALGLLLSTSAFANTNTSGAEMEKTIRRHIVLLPYYGVFDNLSFRFDQGVVTLSGEVNRPTLRRDVERAVSRVSGVQRVVNDIEVLPLSRHDDGLRVRVLRAIYSQTSLQRYGLSVVPSIHIIVRGGHVILEGVVANKADSDIAFIRASGVAGAFSVTNNLRVEDRRS